MNENKQKEQQQMLEKVLNSLFNRRYIPEGFIFESDQVESQMYSGFDLESPYTFVYGPKGVGKQRLINQRLTLESKYQYKNDKEVVAFELDSAIFADPKTPPVPMIDLLITEFLRPKAEEIYEQTSESGMMQALTGILTQLDDLPPMTDDEAAEFFESKFKELDGGDQFEIIKGEPGEIETDEGVTVVEVNMDEDIKKNIIESIINELTQNYKFVFVFSNISALASMSKIDAVLNTFAESIKKAELGVSFIFVGDSEDYSVASSAKSFIDMFNVFKIDEQNDQVLEDLLQDSVAFYESYYGVNIPNTVLEESKKQADKYIKHIARPGNVEKLLSTSLSLSLKRNAKRLTSNDITNAVNVITGIDVNVIKDPVKTLDSKLKKRIIGQDEAISKVAKGLQVRMLGLKKAKGVMFSMLAFGTTGVGKTLIAETVAEILNGSKRMLRLDIGSFKSSELSAARLIGVPSGYKGSEQGGELTEFVKQNPNGVILVDEIEKGEEDVMDIFLSILDHGKISDARGTNVDFSQVTMIFTTNAGSRVVDQERTVGFGSANAKPKTFGSNSTPENIEFLSQWLKPEFLNRFDEVVRFNYLTKDDIRKIARETVENSIKSAQNDGFKFTITDSEKEEIIERAVSIATNGRQAFKTSSSLTEEVLLEKYMNG